MLYTWSVSKTRIVITITTDMQEALARQATRRGATVAGFVRAILGEWLEENGEVVDWTVNWGGHRRRKDDDDAAAE